MLFLFHARKGLFSINHSRLREYFKNCFLLRSNHDIDIQLTYITRSSMRLGSLVVLFTGKITLYIFLHSDSFLYETENCSLLSIAQAAVVRAIGHSFWPPS